MLQGKKRDKKESIDDNLAQIDTWKVGKKTKGCMNVIKAKKEKLTPSNRFFMKSIWLRSEMIQ